MDPALAPGGGGGAGILLMEASFSLRVLLDPLSKETPLSKVFQISSKC